ncbi:STAS domain-containing protein [Planococcus shenhongbingii]|uniref:STAS domain-containing protein n=1 Tax=Planococcus shenhongbingii TaxID=3058398 RepID=UPI00261767AF|nr:STAS domain-containing protein [Planococcus sp. N016]WKA58229.1 STAS domain-containing protein [Planococcus sp. N016]
MEKEIRFLGSRVVEDKNLIAELIQEEALKDASKEELEQYKDILEAVLHFRMDFIGLLGESLQNSLDPETVFKGISQWGDVTGNYFLKEGMSLADALGETSLYRKHIGKVIKTEAVCKEMPLEILFEAMEFFHALLDHAAYSYSSTYINSYQKNLAAARKEFLELSSPVVPVNDQIAILPIVGAIEVDRAQHILEQSLLAAGRLKVSTLIIDLSGVVKVDTMVAEQIIKLTQSLKLVGVQAVLTGIRPEIAQTMIQLGIDVSQLALGGSLKQAFKRLAEAK